MVGPTSYQGIKYDVVGILYNKITRKEKMLTIILLIAYVPLIAWLIWQSYLLSQFDKIVNNQKQALDAMSRANDNLRAENKTLKPF